MAYDALNRLTGKTYSTGMTSVTYSYDAGANGKGRRTGMTDGSGSTADSFDARGRLTQEIKTISGTPYTTSYSYDGADRIVTTTYPTGANWFPTVTMGEVCLIRSPELRPVH